jgi:magnesium-transporting ATPase (P-type)
MSVIEDLRAIESLFSDNAGNMTQNDMKMNKVAARESYYGHSKVSDDIFDDQDLQGLMTNDQDERSS